MDMLRMVRGSMEADVIRRLLSGNDTQCFTTKQFLDMRDRWISEVCGCSYEELMETCADIHGDQASARRQLTDTCVSMLVREVKPDVWALQEGVVL